MNFWDSSAIVHLLIDQGRSEKMRTFLAKSNEMFVWWGSVAEISAAICRLERENKLSGALVVELLDALRSLRQMWMEIPPTEAVLESALRLQRIHPLRAADSLQLAAAVILRDNLRKDLTFVCLDERLATAANKQGFKSFAADF